MFARQPAFLRKTRGDRSPGIVAAGVGPGAYTIRPFVVSGSAVLSCGFFAGCSMRARRDLARETAPLYCPAREGGR